MPLEGAPALGAHGAPMLLRAETSSVAAAAELEALRFAASLDALLAEAEANCPKVGGGEAAEAWVRELLARVGMLRGICKEPDPPLVTGTH